jgi:hypothetical protein
MALKLACHRGLRVSYAVLANQMHLSVFEAHACVARLSASKLLSEVDGVPTLVMPAFRPFLLHGAAHFFPAVRGAIAMGVPTAHGAKPLSDERLSSVDLPPVWPLAEGSTRGMTLLPLYPKLPLAAREDPAFYELLVLFDALRIGQARERARVAALIDERLGKK